jgi:hypothetical protein
MVNQEVIERGYLFATTSRKNVYCGSKEAAISDIWVAKSGQNAGLRP